MQSKQFMEVDIIRDEIHLFNGASTDTDAVLKHWLPVVIAGIAAIWDKEHQKGPRLEDAVGLGKIWEAIGVILNECKW